MNSKLYLRLSHDDDDDDVFEIIHRIVSFYALDCEDAHLKFIEEIAVAVRSLSFIFML